jgi:hypothetical protein
MKLRKILVIVGLVTGVFCGACVPRSTSAELESFSLDYPQSGETIPPASIIDCSGTYAVPQGVDLDDIHVWIILRDDFRNNYLQNPPAELLLGGKWETSNIRIGSGITRILAVQVTQAGHKVFQEKVENEEWRGFVELPEGSEILAAVDITVP